MVEVRRAVQSFFAFNSRHERAIIPCRALLMEFRAGVGHEGYAPEDPDLLSFHYDGHVYYGRSEEIERFTERVSLQA